ncbi:MAG: preprotein translocase subunit SecE [Candidatus Endonucleobacter bathymodioli]|uniref:Protein translocase subunit SecE n=1 Tax=Candidatus Endonucleibacter bathymodioli TaxID=539814 RepID=A0AA90NRQ4_9GAMM|nr:preprotein translocase subunit SecE [Candidatus Endonucleobacter bathymodioli]
MSGKSEEVVVVSRLDGLKWLLVAGIMAAGTYGNYYFSAEPLLYRVVGLLGLVLAGCVIAIQTGKGRAFWLLIKEAKVEIRKVVWPTRQETVQTTLIIVVVVLIMGLILWLLDSALGWAVSSLIG